MSLSKHIDDLFDECLVPVLARVPFNDLVRHVPLTSQRWKALLNLAIRERTSLRLCSKEDHNWNCMQHNYHFIDTGRVSADDYAKYFQCLLNQSDEHQLYAPSDHFLRSTLRAPLCTTICNTFLHLEHLALVDILICPQAFLRLLEHFQKTLKSLFLHLSFNTHCYRHCEHPRINSSLPILSVINSMTSLRQLAFAGNHFSRIEGPLSAVLSRLEELHLLNYGYKNEIFGHGGILFKVDETKFRRLTLQRVSWDSRKLSTLVREKPGLSQLTHLNVTVIPQIPFFGLQTLETAVKVFPHLEHLGISIDGKDDPLNKLMPVLSQLKSLSSLQVTTASSLLQKNFSLALTDNQQIEYRLESLQVLRLETYLSIDCLSILRGLFPNLRQFYLDTIQFQCLCLQSKPAFFRLPSLRPPECTCKVRIADHLDSFEYLPKISIG